MALRNRILLLLLVVLGAFSVCQGGTAALVTHNAVDPLAPGELLTVVFTGPSGEHPSFRVDGVMHGGLLEETTPGVYKGELLITPSMAGRTTRLVVTLEEEEFAAPEPVLLDAAADHAVVITSAMPPRAAFDETVQADTVRMWVDGREVEALRLESNYFVPVEPPTPEAGSHTVRVEAVTIDGETLSREAEIEVVEP